MCTNRRACVCVCKPGWPSPSAGRDRSHACVKVVQNSFSLSCGWGHGSWIDKGLICGRRLYKSKHGDLTNTLQKKGIIWDDAWQWLVVVCGGRGIEHGSPHMSLKWLVISDIASPLMLAAALLLLNLFLIACSCTLLAHARLARRLPSRN